MRLTTALMGAVLTSGCTSVWEAKYGPDKPHISYLMPDQKGGKTGDLFVWHPYTNAAYIANDGGTCIRAADAARVQANATAAGLAAQALGSKVTEVNASFSSELSQAVMLLANQDAKGTFLSVSLFNLCMLAMSGKIKSEDHVVDIFKETLKQASTMSSPVFNDRGQLVLAPSKSDGADEAKAKKEDHKAASGGKTAAVAQPGIAPAIDGSGK